MNQLLFATDLESDGEAGFRFVLPLADVLRARIIFMHVEHIPPTELQASGGMLQEVLKHRREMATKGLHQLKMATAEYAFENNTHIETDHVLSTGLVAEELVHAAKEIKPDMVLVGAGGQKGFPSILAGSIAGQLIRKLDCPLLVIPDHMETFPQGDLLFASGWDEKDDGLLDKTVSLAKQLQKAVTVVHVQLKGEETSLDLEQYIQSKYPDEMKTGDIRSVVIAADSIAEAIAAYAGKHEFAMLVAGHHPHRFEFLHRQIADKLVKDMDIPVLVYQA